MSTIQIHIAVLQVLKDAEYHTISATTLKVIKLLNLSIKEQNEHYNSRKPSDNFSSKKIYTQVQLSVSKLRKSKFIQNFPNTKDEGIFSITNDGLLLLGKKSSERKKIINDKIKKYTKKKISKK
jgi:hypothetical protein